MPYGGLTPYSLQYGGSGTAAAAPAAGGGGMGMGMGMPALNFSGGGGYGGGSDVAGIGGGLSDSAMAAAPAAGPYAPLVMAGAAAGQAYFGSLAKRKAKRRAEALLNSRLNLYRDAALANMNQIQNQLRDTRGSVDQSLVSRGLYNTTVRDTAQQGATNAAAEQFQRINAARATGMDGVLADVQYEGPNTNALASFAEKIGQAITTKAPQAPEQPAANQDQPAAARAKNIPNLYDVQSGGLNAGGYNIQQAAKAVDPIDTQSVYQQNYGAPMVGTWGRPAMRPKKPRVPKMYQMAI